VSSYYCCRKVRLSLESKSRLRITFIWLDSTDLPLPAHWPNPTHKNAQNCDLTGPILRFKMRTTFIESLQSIRPLCTLTHPSIKTWKYYIKRSTEWWSILFRRSRTDGNSVNSNFISVTFCSYRPIWPTWSHLSDLTYCVWGKMIKSGPSRFSAALRITVRTQPMHRPDPCRTLWQVSR